MLTIDVFKPAAKSTLNHCWRITFIILLNLFSSEAKSDEKSEKPSRDSFMEMSDLNKNEW